LPNETRGSPRIQGYDRSAQEWADRASNREIAAHLRAHKRLRGVEGTMTAALLEVAARRLDPDEEGEP